MSSCHSLTWHHQFIVFRKGIHPQLTWVRTAPCRQGGDVSSCSWLWRRERRTSCHSGSRCRGPTAGRPLCCPESGCRRFQSRTDACLATLVGNTSSGCSPGKQQQEEEEEGCFLVKTIRNIYIKKHQANLCQPVVRRPQRYHTLYMDFFLAA